jgi:hypothetical protein
MLATLGQMEMSVMNAHPENIKQHWDLQPALCVLLASIRTSLL